MVQNFLAFVFAKCPFVWNEIWYTAEEVETDFAFIDEITLIQEYINNLEKYKDIRTFLLFVAKFKIEDIQK